MIFDARRSLLRLGKLPLAVSLALACTEPAWAVNFNLGELEGQFDSQLSLGFQWSTSKADQHLIGSANGGLGQASFSDDGRMNFKRGETFSKILKGVHGLELRHADGGIFLRGQYWYDFELQDEERPFKAIAEHNRQSSARAAGSELLDAYFYQRYQLGEQPGLLRLGKQVVNWGEGVFLQGGINAINPVDAAALVRPGSQLKDALLPVNMLYVSQQLTDSLSLQAFYQLDWQQNSSANCGSFFSQTDISAAGCDDNLALLSTQDSLYQSLLAANGGNASLADSLLKQLSAAGASWGSPDEGVLLHRYGDQHARNSGQWGLAVRYWFAPLDSEFSLYAMNYHSRAGIFSTLAPTASALASVNALGAELASTQGAAAAANLAALPLAGATGYFFEYPQDIRLYGLAFSTRLASGADWRGELSYRPNAPVQLNSLDLLYAGWRGLSIGASSPYGGASPLTASPGASLQGYRRKEISQLQTSLSQPFEQVMGAELLTLVGELGWTRVAGLESSARYGRDPVFGSPGSLCSSRKSCSAAGFTTRNSWGYRVRAVWEYPDLLAAVVIKPSLAWSHDVQGYSPAPGGNFEEGRKAVSLGLTAEYQRTFSTSLAYSNFFGGRYSTLGDRDYLELSFALKF